ncbi:MAG: nucleoside hydrolase [Acidimicrobiales bacterium]|nr:nucleoside hydrolase [Acidimicrobiales bacterium]
MTVAHRVVVDTDPGIDDAMAIAVALAAPEIEVLALTTSYGNHRLDVTTANAQRILDTLGVPGIPVVPGAERPLVRSRGAEATKVHGDDGLGDTDLPGPSRRSAPGRPAAELLADTVTSNPGEVTIVAIGPLTNLAIALDHAPGLADSVRQVVVMGGAWNCGGNVTAAAEANLHSDPHAAARVLAAGLPLTLIGLDVTRQLLADRDWLDRLAEVDTPAARLVARTSQLYHRYHVAAERVDGIQCHDVATIAYLLRPDLFCTEHHRVRVVAEGHEAGATRPAGEVDAPPPIAVATGVDAPGVLDLVWRHLVDRSAIPRSGPPGR